MLNFWFKVKFPLNNTKQITTSSFNKNSEMSEDVFQKQPKAPQI